MHPDTRRSWFLSTRQTRRTETQMTGISGSKGNAKTGNWVKNGMKLPRTHQGRLIKVRQYHSYTNCIRGRFGKRLNRENHQRSEIDRIHEPLRAIGEGIHNRVWLFIEIAAKGSTAVLLPPRQRRIRVRFEGPNDSVTLELPLVTFW